MTWGDATSPRHSLDEYVDEDLDDEESFTGPGAAGEKLAEPIKPIIVSSPLSSPLSSPRGSVDLTIDSSTLQVPENNGKRTSVNSGEGVNSGETLKLNKKERGSGGGSDGGSHNEKKNSK